MTDEERFETLLARYRGATAMPDFRAVRQEPRAPRRWPYAVAAAAVIASGIGVLTPGLRREPGRAGIRRCSVPGCRAALRSDARRRLARHEPPRSPQESRVHAPEPFPPRRERRSARSHVRSPERARPRAARNHPRRGA